MHVLRSVHQSVGSAVPCHRRLRAGPRRGSPARSRRSWSGRPGCRREAAEHHGIDRADARAGTSATAASSHRRWRSVTPSPLPTPRTSSRWPGGHLLVQGLFVTCSDRGWSPSQMIGVSVAPRRQVAVEAAHPGVQRAVLEPLDPHVAGEAVLIFVGPSSRRCARPPRPRTHRDRAPRARTGRGPCAAVTWPVPRSPASPGKPLGDVLLCIACSLVFLWSMCRVIVRHTPAPAALPSLISIMTGSRRSPGTRRHGRAMRRSRHGWRRRYGGRRGKGSDRPSVQRHAEMAGVDVDHHGVVLPHREQPGEAARGRREALGSAGRQVTERAHREAGSALPSAHLAHLQCTAVAGRHRQARRARPPQKLRDPRGGLIWSPTNHLGLSTTSRSTHTQSGKVRGGVRIGLTRRARATPTISFPTLEW